MNNKKNISGLKVGVLFGGRSPEHEVSIVSAMQVIGFLSKSHSVVPIYITKDGEWLTHKSLVNASAFSNFENTIKKCSKLVVTPDTGVKIIKNPMSKGLFNRTKKIDIDIVFPVLHGLHGEDGSVQGLLELANIPYVGSNILASAIGLDKVVTKDILIANEIPVLDYYYFHRTQWESNEKSIQKNILDKFRLPVIVKPARLGSSIAVEVANDLDELNLFIGSASKFDTKILIEPYLENSIEVNCSVLGNEKPIASVLEMPAKKDMFLSFKDKYMQADRQRGMEGAKRQIPAPITKKQASQVKKLAIKTFEIIGCTGIARIDTLIDTNNHHIYVNEINTLPGSISYYLWNRDENRENKFTPEVLVDKLLEIAFDVFREKQRTRFHSNYKLLGNIDFLTLKKD